MHKTNKELQLHTIKNIKKHKHIATNSTIPNTPLLDDFHLI